VAAAPNGDIYAGGGFSQAGTCTTGCLAIARWDGARWHALDKGIRQAITAMAFDSTGALYVAGNAGLEKWDDTAWNWLGDPPIPVLGIETMAFDRNDVLYIGGSFKSIQGCPDCWGIAKWNGTAWAPLDRGIFGTVRALAVDSKNTLYVGGDFQNITGSAANCDACRYIATWNGTTWAPLASVPDKQVRTLLFDSANQLYAGGDFTRAGSCISNCKHIALWNGTFWSGIGTGTNNAVYSLTLDAVGTLYAGGTFTGAGACEEGCSFIAGWDGADWFSLDNGMNGAVTGLAVSQSSAVHAVGLFTRAGDHVSRSFAAQAINQVAIPLVIK
jgi:hypothetical protein